MLTGLNDLSYACIECGERVNAEALIEHLDKVHRTECIPYCCEECGYQNADQVEILVCHLSEARTVLICSHNTIYNILSE